MLGQIPVWSGTWLSPFRHPSSTQLSAAIFCSSVLPCASDGRTPFSPSMWPCSHLCLTMAARGSSQRCLLLATVFFIADLSDHLALKNFIPWITVISLCSFLVKLLALFCCLFLFLHKFPQSDAYTVLVTQNIVVEIMKKMHVRMFGKSWCTAKHKMQLLAGQDGGLYIVFLAAR